MAGARIHVELGRHARLAELLVEGDGRRGAAFVERAGGDEGGRRVRDILCRHAERPGEHQDLEIGTAALALDGVGGRNSRRGVCRRGIVGDQRDELASGRKAHHADPLWVDAIVRCVGADPAHRPPRVAGGGALDRVGRARFAGEAVFEDESGDAVAVERQRALHPFIVEHQPFVAAAGEDDDRRSVPMLRIGLVDGQRGIVDVADPIILGNLRLVAPRFGARRAVRPELHNHRVGLDILGRRGCDDEQHECGNEQRSDHRHPSNWATMRPRDALRNGGVEDYGRIDAPKPEWSRS